MDFLVPRGCRGYRERNCLECCAGTPGTPAPVFFGSCFLAFFFLFFFLPPAAYAIWGGKGDQTGAPKISTPVGFYFAFMIFPLFLGGSGLYWAASAYLDGLDTEATDAVVVAIEKQADRNGATYRPVVEYAVGDARFRCHGSVWSGVNTYHVGDRLAVRYKSDEPEIGFIDSFFQRWTAPLAFLASGILFGTWILAGLRQRLQGNHAQKKAKDLPSVHVRFLWWRWRY